MFKKCELCDKIKISVRSSYNGIKLKIRCGDVITGSFVYESGVKWYEYFKDGRI